MKIVEIVDAEMQPEPVRRANFTPEGKNSHGLGITIHHVLGHLAGIVKENDPELVPWVNFYDPRNLFYHGELGENLWNYWFEPIVPPDTSLERAKVSPINFSGMNHWSDRKLKLGRTAWKTYVKLRKDLQEAVDAAYYALDTDNAMAVHIRGTDKWRECIRITPDMWVNEIRLRLESDMPADRLFLATDDPFCVDFMRKAFGGFVFVLPVDRLGVPLHHVFPVSPYHTGFQALTEAFVAARCPYLMRAQSNFTSVILLAGEQKKVGLVGPLWDGDDEKWDGKSPT